MATKRLITRLNRADLLRWRDIFARSEALRFNPDAFTQEESVAAIQAEMEFLGEIAQRYEIAPESEWFVSASTGAITIEI